MIDETKETLSEISEEKLKEEDIDSIKEKVIETPTEKSLQDTKETNLKTTSKSTVAGNTRGNGTNPDEDPLQAAITASYKAEKRTRQFLSIRTSFTSNSFMVLRAQESQIR